MSDKPSNHELSDELLSAYLDGELTADERAAVEARLAVDPAARQLLHELRSVSQSVQAMPTESAGRDLSEDIIRRVRVVRESPVVRGSPDPAPASDRRSPAAADSLMSKVRVFNSRRAWIWASMALAAGLLIMFVQSGDKSANNLPDVAARNRGVDQTQLADDQVNQSRRGEITMSPPPGSAAPQPATISFNGELREKVDALGTAPPAAPMAGEAGGGQSGANSRDRAAAPPVAAASPKRDLRKEGENGVFKAGSASSTAAALSDQIATDKSTVASPPDGQLSNSASVVNAPVEKQKSESTVNPNPQRFIVVRVAARPEALKNGAFDRLLANNKIKLESHLAKNEPVGFGGGNLAKPAKNESAFKDQLGKTTESHAVDMVLVEAPAPAIESCLAELNKNSNDFPSIAVSEESSSHDHFDVNSTLNKKVAETSGNLSRFSRGNAPVAQKEPFDPRYYFYSYDLAKPDEPVVNGSPHVSGEAGAVSGIEHDANGDNKKWYDKGQLHPEVRRARHIETRGLATRQLSEPVSVGGPAAPLQSAAEVPKQPMSQRKPDQPAEAKIGKDNNLKVLFVFTTEEAPAPSAQPDNRPK